MFGEQANAALVARQLIEADRSENSLAGVSTDATQDGGTELKVVRKMLVSHHSVTAFERRLGDLCVAHGGQLDGWGVMQDATPDKPSPAAGGGKPQNRMDAPGDALDEAERNFIEGIRTHGWMQTQALDEDDSPASASRPAFRPPSATAN